MNVSASLQTTAPKVREGGFALGLMAGRFSDASSPKADRLRGASWGTGCGGRAHQKGFDLHRRHGLYFFAKPNRLGNWLGGEFLLSRHPMDQREFPFLQRVGAPSTAPFQWINHAKTYRQAVRLAWKYREGTEDGEEMTKQYLAQKAKLYPQHVTDYLHEDDNPMRRDLPADKVAAFEKVVGNSIVSQWLAARSQLTVLEELQATKVTA